MNPEQELEQYDEEYIQHNIETIEFIRNCLSMFTGTISGILGLKGYNGFIFYLLCSILMTGLIYIFKVLPTKQKSDDLFVNPLSVLCWHGILNALLSHVLFWTLFYGIVHVYI